MGSIFLFRELAGLGAVHQGNKLIAQIWRAICFWRSALMSLNEVNLLLRKDQQSGPLRAMAVRLLLLLLLWSQASFAAHQFEHDVDDLGEACAVCLHFERNDDLIPESHNHAPTVVRPATGDDIPLSSIHYVRPATPYSSRASP